jgi:hypothetical protein
MADNRDRTSRYANPPKGAKKHGAPGADAAETKAEKTAGGDNAPHPDNPDQAGKVGADAGPAAGEDATWGEVASRHTREHGDMLKRHGEEMTATHERHHSEARTMHKRHHGEMKDTAAAAHAAEATAGAPKELGDAKSEGKAGTNA